MARWVASLGRVADSRLLVFVLCLYHVKIVFVVVGLTEAYSKWWRIMASVLSINKVHGSELYCGCPLLYVNVLYYTVCGHTLWVSALLNIE